MKYKLLRRGFICFSLFFNLSGGTKAGETSEPRHKPLLQTITPQKVNHLVRKFCLDSYGIGKNLFTRQSMKVLAATVPFYLTGRKVDSDVHRQFYDENRHKNIHQPPKILKDLLADEAMAIPFCLYGIWGSFNRDPWRRREAQIFAVGLWWTWTSKVILKQIKVDSGLRPWHENFDRHERTHGGSPSGHTSMASFMAAYLWLARGPKYGFPTAIYAGLVASISVVVNHHYVSQVVAGAGLGSMMAFAAHSVLVDIHMPEGVEVGIATDNRGALGVKVAYSF